MSPANISYLKTHNAWLHNKPIEVCPNSIDPLKNFISDSEKLEIRQKYRLKPESVLLIYGGNLGKPQGLDFLLKVIENTKELDTLFFLVFGSGTESPKLKRWFNQNLPQNAAFFETVPKTDFNLLVQTCDVGMIFLDKRFTIPNFPSRLLNYLECSKPVIAATDKNTDLGSIITENGFGYWCESGDLNAFKENVKRLIASKEQMKAMGEKGRKFLEENYLVSKAYSTIMKPFNHK